VVAMFRRLGRRGKLIVLRATGLSIAVEKGVEVALVITHQCVVGTRLSASYHKDLCQKGIWPGSFSMGAVAAR